MSESVIRSTCPHCDARLVLKDRALVGKKIKCPKCRQSFVVETGSGEEIEEPRAKIPRAKSPSQEEDDRLADRQARKKKTRRIEEEEGEERPPRKNDEDRSRKKKKKKKQKGKGLLWALIGGGVALVAVTAVVLVLVLNKGTGEGKGPGPGAQNNQGGAPTTKNKGPDRSLDLAVNVGGSWPEPKVFGGVKPPVEPTLTFHVLIPGLTYKKNGRDALEDIQGAVGDKIGSLLVPFRGKKSSSTLTASDDGPDGNGRRMTIRHGDVVGDPKIIADKINFATVRGVTGRVITLVFSNFEGLPPLDADGVTRALFRLKSSNPFRRKKAADQLKKLPPDQRRGEVVQSLEGMLNDADKSVRAHAIEALGVWGTKETVPLLLKVVAQKAGPGNIFLENEPRWAAMKALGQLKDERACEPLAECLGNDIWDRNKAADELKKFGPAAERAVLKRLSHPNNDVRQTVCQILQVIGSQESLPALEKASADIDNSVRDRAQDAIKKIKARMGG